MTETINLTSPKKFKPGVGVDIGTAFIVVTRSLEDGTFVNKFHRNCLFPLDINDESSDLLERSSYSFIKTKDKYYVCGEDSVNLVNAIGKGSVIRPMKEGLLNPALKESSDLLFYIVKMVLGEPIIKDEPLRYSIPANSIDKDNNNLFHKMVLQSFFNKLGYSAKSINEAMCLVYDNLPISKNDEGEIPLTGIASSHGAGQTNVCLAFKGMSLAEFSCTKSGDNIDEQVEKVTGISRSKIIKIKEKKLDLNNIDVNDRIQTALSIFYDETIDRVIHNITEQFKEKSSEVEGELEWIVAGGSSMPPGFCKRLEEAIKKSSLPFKIYRVRHAVSPFYSVSNGACIRAMSDYQKMQK
jgi:actin-like ATPase involved in cell morphogenesis